MFSKLTEELSPTTTTLLGVLTAVVFMYVVRWMWDMISTPGPWGVPILGYYPFLRKDLHNQLFELSKKHGDVYIINVVGQDFLYLNTLAALKEANVTRADCFTIRSAKESVIFDSLKNGLAFLEGEHWRVQRKFFVQGMKEIGLARNSQELHGPIYEAIQNTLDIFSKSHGEPVELFPVMSKRCTDVVKRLMLGDNITEETVEKLNSLYATIVGPMAGVKLLLMGKRAKQLILSRDQTYKDMVKSTKEMTKMLYDIVNDHKATFDPDQPPRDFIDAYLKERRNKEKKGDPQAKYFTDVDLVATLIQAYGDGSTSVGLFVGMLFRGLSFKRQAQDELYEEIVQIVGQECLPSWEDRANMPLVNSAIKEIFRNMDMITTFPSLECTKETTVMGVKAPVGCVTLMNFWSANHDPRVFDNPDKFDIRRFMPGKTKAEPLLFGIGKRACAGEGLVTTELFLFLMAIVQNFVIEPEFDDEKEECILDFQDLLIKKIRVTPRPGSKYSTSS